MFESARMIVILIHFGYIIQYITVQVMQRVQAKIKYHPLRSSPLPPQIIHNHIPPNSNPTIPKPHHLALMRINHRRLRSEILINRINEQKLPRQLILLALPFPTARKKRVQCAAEHSQRRVEDTNVLPENGRRRQCIQRHRTRITRLIPHQRTQEV